MKAVFILCALVVAVSAHYTTEFDDFDYKEAMRIERLYKGYYNCIMEKGPCTPPGKELKSHIEDALKTKCAECSPKQKDGVRYVCSYIIKHKPNDWKALCNKYDPKGLYAKQYEEELKSVS